MGQRAKLKQQRRAEREASAGLHRDLLLTDSLRSRVYEATVGVPEVPPVDYFEMPPMLFLENSPPAQQTIDDAQFVAAGFSVTE